MLKHLIKLLRWNRKVSAAFGRLCVETIAMGGVTHWAGQPPSGGCVLKLGYENDVMKPQRQPPSGGCVLKPEIQPPSSTIRKVSRLRAAVC